MAYAMLPHFCELHVLLLQETQEVTQAYFGENDMDPGLVPLCLKGLT